MAVPYDSLLTTTLYNRRKSLTDNIFTSTPALWYLSEKNQVRRVAGGVKIREELIYSASSGFGSYSGWDQITISPTDSLTMAEFSWKQLKATVAISGLEELQNSGEEQVINLLDSKIKVAEMAFKDGLNTMLWAASPGAKDFHSITELVDEGTTVGGIAGGTETWWNCQVARPNAGADTNLTEALLRTTYNDATIGNDKPDCIFTTQALFEKYESLLTPNVRYQDVSAANLGFENLMFKGAPMFWDDDVPAKHVFMLNSKYIHLVGHKDRWMVNTPFSKPLSSGLVEGAPNTYATDGSASTVDGRYALILAAGNLTINNRRMHGRIENLVASGGA